MSSEFLTINEKKIHPLGLGAGAFAGDGGGYAIGNIDEDQVKKVLDHAYDQGLNIIDNAPIYGLRESEKRVGRLLKSRRDDFFLTSKCGITWHDNGRINLSNDAQTCQSMLENSLKDLKTDVIDLYFIHYPDPRNDIRFAMEVLAKAKMEGKIRYIGLSNTTCEEFQKALEIEKVDALQGEYNFWHQEALNNFESEIKEYDLKFFGWGTLDKGILTGNVTKDTVFDKNDVRSWAPWWKKSNKNQRIDQAKKLKEILLANGVLPSHFCIHYSLRNEHLTAALCGMKSEFHIDDLIQGMNLKIEDDLWNEIMEQMK